MIFCIMAASGKLQVKGEAMRKSIIIVAFAAVLACALAFALAGCVQVTVQGKGSSESASSAASVEAGASSGAVSAGSPSATSGSAASSASPSTASAQGAPQVTTGELNMVEVHGTDTGVGADVVVQVKNTGDVPLVMASPTIRIADESGKVIVDESGNGLMTGPSYLRVGDVGFIYTSGPLPLPAGYFPGYNYTAQASADLNACKEVYEYPLSNLKISEDGSGVPIVTGTVTNDDSVKADLIELTAVFLDNDGNVLGVATDIVVNVAPGESKDFTIDGYTLPVGCTMAVISDYDTIAVAPKF